MVSLQPPAPGGPRGARARRPEKLAETVARRIVHDISDRGLQPGAVLPSEKQMSAQYEVARGTLREALRILEIHGLIQMKLGPGGGPVVNETRSDELGRMLTLFLHGAGATMADLMDARIVIEPMAARAAALSPNREAVARLRTAIDDDNPGSPRARTGCRWRPTSTTPSPRCRATRCWTCWPARSRTSTTPGSRQYAPTRPSPGGSGFSANTWPS